MIAIRVKQDVAIVGRGVIGVAQRRSWRAPARMTVVERDRIGTGVRPATPDGGYFSPRQRGVSAGERIRRFAPERTDGGALQSSVRC